MDHHEMSSFQHSKVQIYVRIDLIVNGGQARYQPRRNALHCMRSSNDWSDGRRCAADIRLSNP